MYRDILGFNGEALGSGSHLVLLLVIASLIIALLVRLGMTIFATERVEERNRVTPQPATAGREWSSQPGIRSGSGREHSPELLQTTVMRYFERLEECCSEPQCETSEEQTIRTQRDNAAELYRSFKVERAALAPAESEAPAQHQPCWSPVIQDTRDPSELLSIRLQSICVENDSRDTETSHPAAAKTLERALVVTSK